MLPPRRSPGTSERVDKGAGSGRGREGKYRPSPTSRRRRPGHDAQRGHAAEPSPPRCLASPRVVLSLSLSSSPPAPFPVSSSRLLCSARGALGARAVWRCGGASRPSSAASRRCPSAARPRGSAPGGAAPAARRGPSRPGPGGAAEGEGRERGREGPGAGTDTALGPLKGAVGPGEIRRLPHGCLGDKGKVGSGPARSTLQPQAWASPHRADMTRTWLRGRHTARCA